jgi:hypothetical protein
MGATISICDIVESWLRANAERLGWKTVRLARDRDRGTLGAGYELPGAVVSIGAWEQGFALDVDVLEVATGSGHMVCSGACADENAVRSRLASIAPWVTEHVRI